MKVLNTLQHHQLVLLAIILRQPLRQRHYTPIHLLLPNRRIPHSLVVHEPALALLPARAPRGEVLAVALEDWFLGRGNHDGRCALGGGGVGAGVGGVGVAGAGVRGGRVAGGVAGRGGDEGVDAVVIVTALELVARSGSAVLGVFVAGVACLTLALCAGFQGILNFLLGALELAAKFLGFALLPLDFGLWLGFGLGGVENVLVVLGFGFVPGGLLGGGCAASGELGFLLLAARFGGPFLAALFEPGSEIGGFPVDLLEVH